MPAMNKYIVLKVIVEHEAETDPVDICGEVEVFCDAVDGAITISEVVGVYNNEPEAEN